MQVTATLSGSRTNSSRTTSTCPFKQAHWKATLSAVGSMSRSGGSAGTGRTSATSALATHTRKCEGVAAQMKRGPPHAQPVAPTESALRPRVLFRLTNGWHTCLPQQRLLQARVEAPTTAPLPSAHSHLPHHRRNCCSWRGFTPFTTLSRGNANSASGAARDRLLLPWFLYLYQDIRSLLTAGSPLLCPSFVPVCHMQQTYAAITRSNWFAVSNLVFNSGFWKEDVKKCRSSLACLAGALYLQPLW